MPSKKPQEPPKASAERITLTGEKRARVVYVGARGGKYLRMDGKYVSVKSLPKSGKKLARQQKGGLTDEEAKKAAGLFPSSFNNSSSQTTQLSTIDDINKLLKEIDFPEMVTPIDILNYIFTDSDFDVPFLKELQTGIGELLNSPRELLKSFPNNFVSIINELQTIVQTKLNQPKISKHWRVGGGWFHDKWQIMKTKEFWQCVSHELGKHILVGLAGGIFAGVSIGVSMFKGGTALIIAMGSVAFFGMVGAVSGGVLFAVPTIYILWRIGSRFKDCLSKKSIKDPIMYSNPLANAEAEISPTAQLPN